MKRLFLAFLLLTSGALAAEVTKLAVADAAALVREGKAVLVDVREPAEWAETGVAAPAVLLPKSDFDQDSRGDWKAFLEKNGAKQIILYCRSGRRSGQVAEALAAKGYKTANAGGFKDWQAAGLPTRQIPPAKP